MPKERIDADTVLVTANYLKDDKKLHLVDPDDPTKPKCSTETTEHWRRVDPATHPNSEFCTWCTDGREKNEGANFEYYNALKAAAKDD